MKRVSKTRHKLNTIFLLINFKIKYILIFFFFNFLGKDKFKIANYTITIVSNLKNRLLFLKDLISITSLRFR